MPDINNYGTRGISNNVRLGKAGPRVVGSSNKISLRNSADTDDALLAAGAAVLSSGNLTLVNTSSNITISDTSMSRQSLGVLKFDGTSGIVLPTGATDTRPQAASGLVRVNTDVITASYIELHNGYQWLGIISDITAVNQTTAIFATRLALAQLVMRQNILLWS